MGSGSRICSQSGLHWKVLPEPFITVEQHRNIKDDSLHDLIMKCSHVTLPREETQNEVEAGPDSEVGGSTSTFGSWSGFDSLHCFCRCFYLSKVSIHWAADHHWAVGHLVLDKISLLYSYRGGRGQCGAEELLSGFILR